MLEPDSFATNNLFPAGKVRKTWGFMGFLVETPHKEKTLARTANGHRDFNFSWNFSDLMFVANNVLAFS